MALLPDAMLCDKLNHTLFEFSIKETEILESVSFFQFYKCVTDYQFYSG